MTLHVAHTAIRIHCQNELCKKVIGELHNGMIYLRVGKNTATMPSGSIQCGRCGHWNHVTAKESAGIV